MEVLVCEELLGLALELLLGLALELLLGLEVVLVFGFVLVFEVFASPLELCGTLDSASFEVEVSSLEELLLEPALEEQAATQRANKNVGIKTILFFMIFYLAYYFIIFRLKNV